MDVKKIKLEEVKDGSLKFELVRKELQKSIAEMEVSHTTFDTAIDFYVCMDQKYDNGKSEALLIALGTLKNSWKAHTKAQFKDGTQKKKVLAGVCYLEIDGNNKVLQLIPKSGSAKLGKIAKNGKIIFNKAGVTLGIPKEFARAEDLEEDNSTEEATSDNNTNKENLSDNKTDSSPSPSPNEKLANTLKTTWAEFSTIAASLKTITDKVAQIQARYNLYTLNETFVKTMVQYNEALGDNNATEKLLPGIADKIASIKKQLDENPQTAAIVKIGDAFKSKIARLNQLLKSINEPTINI